MVEVPSVEIRACALAITWAGELVRTATANRAGARTEGSPERTEESLQGEISQEVDATYVASVVSNDRPHLRIPGRGCTVAASYPARCADPSSHRAAKHEAAGRQHISAMACLEMRRSETRRVVGAALL